MNGSLRGESLNLKKRENYLKLPEKEEFLTQDKKKKVQIMKDLVDNFDCVKILNVYSGLGMWLSGRRFAYHV
jgi:hypothetical protein